jgi:hypothetical protein
MKPYWSISEACAWIVTGDLDAVEHVSISDPEAAHFLIGGDALPPYQFCEHVFEWPASCGWHALTQIEQYCGDERIAMFGVPEDDGIHESIPGTAWAALKISHSERLACFVAAPPPVGNPTTWWARLRLRSADVQQIWPPLEAAPELYSEPAHPPSPTPTPDPAPDLPLRKIKNAGETQVSQARGYLRQLFPDSDVEGSYAELADRIDTRFGKRFEKDTIRRALGRKS